jgi:V/A-type H+-transporting ATPase subunit E
MDVQLQELIDKIKKDGVASAESTAQKIIAEAEKKAASIISDAEEKADGIIKNAKTETARMEKSSEEAITQAGRNLIISFRDSVTKELSGIVSAETAKAYDKDMLKKLIPETVKAWASNPDAKDITVLLAPKDLKELQSSLQTALKAQISKGLELKSDSSISAGFRIGAKDGSAFYDFSAEEVANLFGSYLNPKTAELMKNAAAGIEAPAEEKKPAKKTAAKGKKE